MLTSSLSVCTICLSVRAPSHPIVPCQDWAFDVGSDSYPHHFSPIQMPSSRLFRLFQEWEHTLCFRSEQFASFIERKRTNNGTLDIESVIARSCQLKIRFHSRWNCPVANSIAKLSLTIQILLFISKEPWKNICTSKVWYVLGKQVIHHTWCYFKLIVTNILTVHVFHISAHLCLQDENYLIHLWLKIIFTVVGLHMKPSKSLNLDWECAFKEQEYLLYKDLPWLLKW